MEKTKLYRADIDGLRAVAVLGVVFNHLSASMVPGGYVGVDVFFVISGYLITRIISQEIAEGRFTYARFYERRVRRIFPALFAMLAVTLVAGYLLLLPSDYASTLRATLGTLFFSSNVVFWREMARGYFDATDAMLNPLLHTWSLGVEEQFYLLFPVLLIFCFRHFRHRIPAILLTCAIISLVGAALLVESKSVAVFFLSPFRAWELLVGSLLAINAVPAIRSRIGREVLSGAGLVAILVSFFAFDHKTTFPGLAALLPVLGAAAIIHAGEKGQSAVARLLKVRPVVYVGLISYSLYLWHWPLIVFFRYGNGMQPIAPHFAILLLASLLLGAASYHFIEQPFRRSSLISRRWVVSTAGGFATLFVVIATSGLALGGFETRFSPDVARLDAARSPVIPYRQCDGQVADAWCRLGEKDGKPTVVIWGDSHALAWAPALHEVFLRQGVTVVFANNSACPPFFDHVNEANISCSSRNDEVKRYLDESEISTVLLSANWNGYFKDEGPIRLERNGIDFEGVEASQRALIETLDWLEERGKDVVLFGPVPVYDKSVPMIGALELVLNKRLLDFSKAAQLDKYSSFFETIEHYRSRNWLTFLDPIQWMCPDTHCLSARGGEVFYRDAHHLSLAGALEFVPQIEAAIGVGVTKHKMVSHAGAPALN